ncbi:hypothetical protein [Vibrio nitrifigilis]|uniref:Uncharacterized protein n=1 Tax=Vibrio nitrifigilis TaxID=2789781 RepID=A0ABS0GA45_9VIBR|nr:hypothetical protein [Vibrio nitrifigilis]MBF8999281.1 hypothetical protein [Vibrio nitrifigilis]MBF9001573.1 hypothetical protein [Vibrio nitrifigilis]
MTENFDSDKPDNVRTYRSIPNDEMQSDNPLSKIHQWKYIWVAGSGVNYTCDFKDWLQYSTKGHVSLLISKFEQSGWAEATKVTNFKFIGDILKHNFNSQSQQKANKAEFSAETCVNYIQASWLSQRTTGVGLHGKPIKASTLGWRASSFNSILKKFGFGQIPKAARNLDTVSASLDSNNYNKKELKRIARALLSDRKLLYKEYLNEAISEGKRTIVFNRLIYNAVFLYVYYTAAGQTEALNTFVVEDGWSVDKAGGKRISVKGLKTRGYKEESRSFTPRAVSKTFFEEHFELSKLNAVYVGLDKHYLFRRRDGKKPRAENLHIYIASLMRRSVLLQTMKAANPDFSLTCERLKSSIKQYAEEKLGRQEAMESSRNLSESTWNNSDYSKNSKAVAHRELAFGTATLFALGCNPTGGVTAAIATTKAQHCEVLSSEEVDVLRASSSVPVDDIANGGVCKGEDVPQKREFQKSNLETGLLDDDDVKNTACGYVIKCFICRNFAVVDEVHDIWRLLSFEFRLNEAVVAHKSLDHFIKNFSEVKSAIRDIKKRFKKRNLKAAEKYLERQGCHPLWDEDSIQDIFKG